MSVLTCLLVLVAGCSVADGPGKQPSSTTAEARPSASGYPVPTTPDEPTHEPPPLPPSAPSPSDVPDDAVTSSPASPSSTVEAFAYLRGVNTQGGGGSREDPKRVPGVVETDYHWNSQAFYDFIASRGHRVVRIDFLWERVQPVLGAGLDGSRLRELQEVVARAERAGLRVILDMKNYGRYWLPDDSEVMLGAGISVEQFEDVWYRLGMVFAEEDVIVGLGLMNEPWGLPVELDGRGVWKKYSQAAVDAVRAAGYRGDVFVAGDQWGGVWNWSGINGPPWIADPAGRTVYEAHIYFDADTSGRYAQSFSVVQADARARGFQDLADRIDAEVANYTAWLQDHDVRGFIGEIGWPNDRDASEWNSLGDHVYDTLNDAGLGATYWAAGEWLATGDGRYPLDAYAGAGLQAQPQATVIEDPEHLSRSAR